MDQIEISQHIKGIICKNQYFHNFYIKKIIMESKINLNRKEENKKEESFC